jgi:hypothetical protein
MRLSADTQPQIATNNLITKVSFENAVTDSKNGISGSAVTYAREQAYKGSASSFISQHCS